MSGPGDAQIARFEAIIEAFNRDGIEAWKGFVTDDVVVVTAPGFPGGGRFVGAEATAFIEEFLDAWDEVTYVPSELRLEGGAVVHRARWVVRGRESQVPVTVEFFAVVRLRGDRMASMEVFWQEAEALDHARSKAA